VISLSDLVPVTLPVESEEDVVMDETHRGTAVAAGDPAREGIAKDEVVSMALSIVHGAGRRIGEAAEIAVAGSVADAHA